MNERQLDIQEQNRYARHLSLSEIGVEGQMKLSKAKVLVVGAGGLGCPVLQYLSAAGVGQIGIIDFDVVSVSNLQRQILYTTEDIGYYKADRAAKRIRTINPLIQVYSYVQALSVDTALDIIKLYDIVVDATDNFSTRYLINDACVILNIPFVFASIHSFQGQLAVCNYKGGATYRCLYPEPPENAPSCSQAGVLGVLPGIIGTLQANELIKMIVGFGHILTNKLLTIDTKTLDVSIFRISPVVANQSIKTLISEAYACSSADVLSKEAIPYSNQTVLIDVRTAFERRQKHIDAIHIPLEELPQYVGKLSDVSKIILYCTTGVRSQRAKSFLQKKLPHTLIELYDF